MPLYWLGASSSASAVATAVESITLGELITFVATTGLLSMLFIETFKRLTSVRARYHSSQTRKWLRGRSESLDYSLVPRSFIIRAANLERQSSSLAYDLNRAKALELDEGLPPSLSDSVAEELEDLYATALRKLRFRDGEEASGDLRAALVPKGWRALGKSALNLPTEQYVAQVGAAVESTLTERQFSSALWRVFALPSESFDDRPERESTEAQNAANPFETEFGYIFDRQVVQSLDRLQTQLSNEWQFRIRLAAVLTSGFLSLILASLVAQQATLADGSPSAPWALAIAGFVLGGPVAWFSRDAVAIVEKLRQ